MYSKATALSNTLRIPTRHFSLKGELHIPADATGIVLFAHGSGSSRKSPRNQFVARTIHEAGVGTLLFDLLTPEEEAVDIRTRRLRFDIELLAKRLVDATGWIQKKKSTLILKIGYFGSSTGGRRFGSCRRTWSRDQCRGIARRTS